MFNHEKKNKNCFSVAYVSFSVSNSLTKRSENSKKDHFARLFRG